MPDIGDRFEVPKSVCETGVIHIVGRETNKSDKRYPVMKIERPADEPKQPAGEFVCWCCEVVKDAPRGAAFGIDSSEFTQFTKLNTE